VEKLRHFYDQFSGDDQVLVLINADPDAIASAMAVKRLLWRRVAGVTLSNINTIQRPDNLAMVRLLDVNLVHVDEIKPENYSRFVIVDSQPSHNEAFGAFEFDIVIDHHPVTDVTAGFVDIREKYGATASILTEYLRAANIKPSVKLATGLFYAIKNDTSNFERAALMEDVRAFQFLFRHANTHLARRIDQTELQMGFLKFFRKALHEKRIRKGKIFAHVGQVPTPDILVLIADFFMRVELVKWSIVSGIHDRKLILVFRNDGLRKNAGKLARERFGNLGSAGGHKSMSRAEMPIENLRGLTECRDDTKLLMWIINQVTRSTKKRAVKKCG
jgi:nanoRNase/pAp phosphatase (c-di-AMP/oligoRNAs hydrolase)